MTRPNKCNTRKCTCGDQKYIVKNAVPSVHYSDFPQDNVYELIDKMQKPCHDYKPIGASLTEKIVRRAEIEVDELRFESKANGLAKFDLSEIVVGRILGSGGFSNVFEISALNPNGRSGRTYSSLELTRREALVRDCQTKSSRKMTPFAIKHLRRRLIEKPNRFANGAIDLVLEATFLSSLDHPNILKIHGHSTEGLESYYHGRHDSYFLILERLTETLQDRVVTWRKEHKKLKSSWIGSTERRSKRMKQLMGERLEVATSIASALRYLHSRGLVYRDLKPNNIGFGLDGKIKLFDFGLCRELPVGADAGLDTVYDMSGEVGTYKYMSPEVANREHYNQGADVFSFGIVLFEILSLNQPSVKEGCRTVDPCQWHICQCWPQPITELMIQTWSPFISERPTMNEICAVLRSNVFRVDGTAFGRLHQDGECSLGSSLFDGRGLEKPFSLLQGDDMSSGTLSMSSMSLQP